GPAQEVDALGAQQALGHGGQFADRGECRVRRTPTPAAFALARRARLRPRAELDLTARGGSRGRVRRLLAAPPPAPAPPARRGFGRPLLPLLATRGRTARGLAE